MSTSTTDKPLSPRQRAWRRFRQHRLGYWSLWIFVALFSLSLCAELVCNDKPLFVRYQGETVRRKEGKKK